MAKRKADEIEEEQEEIKPVCKCAGCNVELYREDRFRTGAFRFEFTGGSKVALVQSLPLCFPGCYDKRYEIFAGRPDIQVIGEVTHHKDLEPA